MVPQASRTRQKNYSMGDTSIRHEAQWISHADSTEGPNEVAASIMNSTLVPWPKLQSDQSELHMVRIGPHGGHVTLPNSRK